MHSRPNIPQLHLFITGLVQVFFVAVNTYFLANGLYVGVAVASFCISIIWSWNVRKVVFGSFLDRVIYSAGAMTGSVLGLFFSEKIVSFSL